MGASRFANQSILVVDDDPNICRTLHRILSEKYEVHVANSVNAAYNNLYRTEFAVTIIDYNLQDTITGMKFAQYVKTVNPLIYTIMLTGNSDFRIVQEALNQGNVNKFMTKPFTVENLLDIVDEGQVDYSSKVEIAELLQSDDGIKMAQDLVTQVFDESNVDSSNHIDLSAVVISRNSIPLYSKFLDTKHLKKFTDTIFSGFMTAINMVGQEVFNNQTKVDILKFGEISIYFKFHEQYQFCFIIRHKNEILLSSDLQIFDTFFDTVKDKIEEDPHYFIASNNYIDDLNTLLETIRPSITL